MKDNVIFGWERKSISQTNSTDNISRNAFMFETARKTASKFKFDDANNIYPRLFCISLRIVKPMNILKEIRKRRCIEATFDIAFDIYKNTRAFLSQLKSNFSQFLWKSHQSICEVNIVNLSVNINTWLEQFMMT